MMKSFVLQVAAVLISLFAAYMSYNLLQKHYKSPSTPAWFEAGCSDETVIGDADCDTVIRSKWGTIRGVPTSLLGLMYYACLTIWIIGVGRPSPKRWWIHLVPVAMIVPGLGFSFFLTFEMFFSELEAWCPWCMVVHVANFMILVCVMLMWPGGGKSDVVQRAASTSDTPSIVEQVVDPPTAGQFEPPSVTGSTAATPTTIQAPPHPVWRQVAATVLAMAVVSTSLFWLSSYPAVYASAQKYHRNFVQAEKLLKRLQNDINTLMTNWELADKQEFNITEQTPVRPGKGKKTLRLVTFGDFECPHCRRFALFVEEKVQPLFDGNLTIVYKHYPINKLCNPKSVTMLHPRACLAAAVAEAAWMQGGNDKFWEVHDIFYGDPNKLRSIDPTNPEDVKEIERLAEDLQLNPERFVIDMQSPDIGKRLLNDINEAVEAGVSSTPSAFVNGKQVHSLAMMNLGFWRAMALLYWRTIGETPPPEVAQRLRGGIPAEKEQKETSP